MVDHNNNDDALCCLATKSSRDNNNNNNNNGNNLHLATNSGSSESKHDAGCEVISDSTSKSHQLDVGGGRGRRVKQPRPTRSAARGDDDFRGVICRFDVTFDGRQTRLHISTEYRLERKRTCGGWRRRRADGLRRRATDVQSDSDDLELSTSSSTCHTTSPTLSKRVKQMSPAAAAKTCASCSVNKTPLWRDAEDGTPLCNACGIRYKKYRLRCSRCWHIPRKQCWTHSPTVWKHQSSLRCQKCGFHQSQQQQQQHLHGKQRCY